MAPRSRNTRSTGANKARPIAKQSSLSFQNRITKPGKDKKPTESEIKAAKLLAETESQSSVVEDVKPEEPVDEIEAEPEAEAESKPIPIRSQNGPEAEARKVSDAAIKRYWKAKEGERKTPRLHQEGLSLHEKILREFDMSYQYGPCIGITRTRRWTRAQGLGLDPPIEVLAVLLKEDGSQKDKKFERAQMDLLVNSRLGIVAQ